MRVVSTFFHSSSVLYSAKCRLDETSTEYLVVSRTSRLEVFALLPEGAKLRCSLEIWGVVSSLSVVPHGDGPSTLLVTTEPPDPLVMLLEYVPEQEDEDASLREYNHLSLHSSFSRTMEDFEGAIVHPRGDVAVVATYVGKLKALVLKGSEKRVIKSEFDCILTELNVQSICFLPVLTASSRSYELAVLHRDHTGVLKLTSHELNVQTQELSLEVTPSLPQVTISDEDARILMPIPATEDAPGGVLVLGGQNILYFEVRGSNSADKGKGKAREKITRKSSRKRLSSNNAAGQSIEPRAQVDWPLSDLTACAVIDMDDERLLLGDNFGQLSILSLARENMDVSLTLVRLGETSPATTITHLNSGVVFIGSHFGDSQVVRISPSSNPLEGIQLDILDSFTNLAPVMDALMVDTDNSGQAQIVTCSGAHNTGSLKIVRNGADLQEIAVVDNMAHVKLMWPLRSSYEALKDDILAVSTLQSTYFYSLASTEHGTLNELDEESYPGFSHEPTLAIGNMACIVFSPDGSPRYEDGQHVIQVTRTGVFLVNLFSGMRDSTWISETDIVAASINASQIAVALKGRRVVILMVKDGELTELRSRVFDEGEISSITVASCDSAQPFSNFVAIGFYESNTVGIWNIADLKRSLLAPVRLPHLPVSLLLAQFGLHSANQQRHTNTFAWKYPTHLLVGLGDGNLRIFGLDTNGDVASVMEEKLISLGSTRPVFITPFNIGMDADLEGRSVLACGSRPIVLYWEKGRLKNSPLVRKGICAACPLNSNDFPATIVFATLTEREGKMDSTSLLIGRLRELKKLHVRTIPFGLDNPVRISHHSELRVFGVGCQRVQPHRVGEIPLESGSFKIIDDTTFEQQHHFPLETNEEVTALQTLSLTLEDEGARKQYFVLGTQYQSEEFEAQEGRLLLFDARTPWLPEPRDDGRHEPRSEKRNVGLVASSKVKGCVFALAEVHGLLVAAVNESVYIFRVKNGSTNTALPSTHGSIELEQVAKWTHNYIVSNMVARGERIYIGDTISSLSVVEWDASQQRLQNVARDYAPLWPVSIQALDNDSIIGCNNDCNLFVFAVNGTDKRLEQAGNYYMGDCVNKFAPGVLFSQPVENQSVRPEYMFFTATGRIGVISELDKEYSLHMTALQRNLANVISSPGNVKHARWRAPKNSRGVSDAAGDASGFLDGDFLERVLTYEGESLDIQQVMSGRNEAEKLGIPYSEMIRVLEQLQSMH